MESIVCYCMWLFALLVLSVGEYIKYRLLELASYSLFMYLEPTVNYVRMLEPSRATTILLYMDMPVPMLVLVIWD